MSSFIRSYIHITSLRWTKCQEWCAAVRSFGRRQPIGVCQDLETRHGLGLREHNFEKKRSQDGGWSLAWTSNIISKLNSRYLPLTKTFLGGALQIFFGEVLQIFLPLQYQVEPSLTLSNDLKRACELLERWVSEIHLFHVEIQICISKHLVGETAKS